MNFEAYLSSKKIDSDAFKKAEPLLWDSWRKEFEQVHPNSFTAQKLYLINPLRRKYLQAIVALPEVLKSVEAKLPEPKDIPIANENTDTEIAKPKPVVARPVVKPKLPSASPSIASDTSTSEQTPPIGEPTPAKPTAKPVIARPVIKPKPVSDHPVKADESSSEKTSDANITEVKEEEVLPAQKPTPAKPVMSRPVIKPKQISAEPATPDETTVPLPDNAKSPDINQAETTPPAKASKPAIPRPVIKPPKPKID